MAVRLCERDFEMMLAMARNGFLKVDQIQETWFKSYWSCIKRLEKLKDKDSGYLDVTYIERNGRGIYYLTKEGLQCINGYFGTSYKQYSRSNKILHCLSCSDFYINLPDRDKIQDYEMEYYLNDFIPDIYLTYKEQKEIDCLVEIDNLGRVNRFIPKIKKYNEFLESGKWKDHFKAFPRCIVVSNCRSIQEAIKNHSRIPFKFISFDELKRGGLRACLE